MPRRKKQSRGLLQPLAENFLSRLSNADARLRRRVIRIGIALVSLVFFYSLMVGSYGVPRIIRLELEKKSLIDANRKVLVELVDADRTKKMLENDGRYIEYVARTRYRMVLPNEVIYYSRGY
jgi:cell division protein FtsB